MPRPSKQKMKALRAAMEAALRKRRFYAAMKRDGVDGGDVQPPPLKRRRRTREEVDASVARLLKITPGGAAIVRRAVSPAHAEREVCFDHAFILCVYGALAWRACMACVRAWRACVRVCVKSAACRVRVCRVHPSLVLSLVIFIATIVVLSVLPSLRVAASLRACGRQCLSPSGVCRSGCGLRATKCGSARLCTVCL
jgi:hypothetical protein